MIRYTLRCSQDHHFEEWFSNSAEYDEKKEAAELACPECGDKHVSKAIMAPSVSKATAPAPRCMPGGCGGCAFSGEH